MLKQYHEWKSMSRSHPFFFYKIYLNVWSIQQFPCIDEEKQAELKCITKDRLRFCEPRHWNESPVDPLTASHVTSAKRAVPMSLFGCDLFCRDVQRTNEGKSASKVDSDHRDIKATFWWPCFSDAKTRVCQTFFTDSARRRTVNHKRLRTFITKVFWKKNPPAFQNIQGNPPLGIQT